MQLTRLGEHNRFYSKQSMRLSILERAYPYQKVANMAELSAGASIAWKIAAIETANAKHHRIILNLFTVSKNLKRLSTARFLNSEIRVIVSIGDRYGAV